MKKIQLDKWNTEIFLPDLTKREVPFVFVNSDSDQGEALFHTLKDICDEDFVLICVNVDDWNDDLSPWPCEPIFKGTKPFAGKADLHLTKLLDHILPCVKERLQEEGVVSSYDTIAGYSLAGLFALYSAYRTEAFRKIVSASGSLWYPGFLEFTRKNAFSPNVDSIYLSLGDKESHTKNKLMSTVSDMTQTISDELGEITKVVYEMNEGNHFKDPDPRLAKGIAHILNT